MIPDLPLPTALVADPSHVHFNVSGGVESVFNDPFLHRYGARLTVAVAPRPWLEASFVGVYFPILGTSGSSVDPDWKVNFPAWHALSQCDCTPDISLIDAELQGVMRIRALSYRTDAWTFAFGAFAGLTLVHTVDDFNALQVAETDPDYVSTAIQWHPGPVGGLFWDARSGQNGVRVRYEQIRYIEAINGGTLESKNTLSIGVEYMRWF